VTLFAAITTALYQRERTGRGGLVSTSLLANGLWSNAIQVQAQLSGVRYVTRLPRSHAPNPLSNIYQCRCGRWLSLVVLNEARQLGPLLAALGLDHLQGDPRLASADSRTEHNAAIIALFDQGFAEHDLATWRLKLDAAGITFGVVGTLADMDDDAQMRAAGVLVPYAHRPGTTVATPIRVHGSPVRPPGPAPALGEHSRAVLAEAGYDADEIKHLLASRVVQQHQET
jgi:crotonobetainyl-CoA:carnitine CoA-transferase CaiB-like acyl-CoA transferase